MPVAINISEDEILYAESILLPAHTSFDDERRAFIKNLSSIDLQAVPGSGKTTALLAKLLILARKLPFPDGSGILVISHTNTAVDEIKRKIGKYCPGLFSYPNFCGTIQSFTDEFLAKPYYSKKYNKRIVRIDNEIYNDSHYIPGAARAWLANQQNGGETILRESRLFGTDDLRYGFSNTRFPLNNKTSATYLAIVDLKDKIRQKGFLCYDDAYILGFEYLEKIPLVKTLLQKRFSYVFVDEMQDMDKHQYELLEKIFWDDGNGFSKYQRIGDKNQAIYNDDAKLETIWNSRDQVLELNGSHRLSAKIAHVVQPMALNPINIIGQKKNDDGTDISIKPHLIVYGDATIKQVIPKFAEIIETLRTSNLIPANSKHVYRAVAWNTKPEANKIRLCDYYPAFSKEENKPKIDYNSLESYLVVYSKEALTLETIRKNILNAFLRILRLENILDRSQWHYSKRRLLSFISLNHTLDYEKFKLKLYQWSISIIKGQKDATLMDIKQYLPEFIQLFGQQINQCTNFINDAHTVSAGTANTRQAPTVNPNIYRNGNTEVLVTTVHSVKGQTHTGTLYLETFYSRGQGNYESERLAAQLKGTPFNTSSIDIVKQSAKMMYVGLSRPTHLVCMAIQKGRFNAKLNDIDRNVWEVVEV